MPRNYKNENYWEREKYKRLVAKIDKQTAERFLKCINKPYAIWLKEKISEELNNKEDLKMKKIIKELKEELLNKEITLLELDNTAERITESTTSLFDYTECIEDNSCAYYMEKDKDIVIEWEVVEKAEDDLNTIVKVTDIWED